MTSRRLLLPSPPLSQHLWLRAVCVCMCVYQRALCNWSKAVPEAQHCPHLLLEQRPENSPTTAKPGISSRPTPLPLEQCSSRWILPPPAPPWPTGVVAGAGGANQAGLQLGGTPACGPPNPFSSPASLFLPIWGLPCHSSCPPIPPALAGLGSPPEVPTGTLFVSMPSFCHWEGGSQGIPAAEG